MLNEILLFIHAVMNKKENQRIQRKNQIMILQDENKERKIYIEMMIKRFNKTKKIISKKKRTKRTKEKKYR